jgi:hypothetical protein
MSLGMTLVLSTIFGAFGVGYFMYGKKQAHLSSILCGFALVVFPWFVDSVFWTVIVGLVLMAIPFLVGV